MVVNSYGENLRRENLSNIDPEKRNELSHYLEKKLELFSHQTVSVELHPSNRSELSNSRLQLKILADNLDDKAKDVFFRAFGLVTQHGNDKDWCKDHFLDNDKTIYAFRALDITLIIRSLTGKKDPQILKKAFLIASDPSESIDDITDKDLREFGLSLKGCSEEFRAQIIDAIECARNEIWSTHDISLKRDPVIDCYSELLMTNSIQTNSSDLEKKFNEEIDEIERREPRLAGRVEGQGSEWEKRRLSWSAFKHIVKTYPKKTLFNNTNDSERKKEYYNLGLRYLHCVLSTIGTSQVEYVIDCINVLPGEDSFLESCKTGWSERIIQLESLCSDSSNQNLSMRPLIYSIMIRRNAVKDYISKKILLKENDSQSVHVIENFRSGMNKVFNLGYPESEFSISKIYSPSDYFGLYTFLETSLIEELSGKLVGELQKMDEGQKKVLFEHFLDYYYEKAKEDSSILLDSWEDAKKAFDKIGNVGWTLISDVQKLKNIKQAIAEYVDVSHIECRTPQQKFFDETLSRNTLFFKLNIPVNLSVEEKIALAENRLTTCEMATSEKKEELRDLLNELKSKEKNLDIKEIKKALLSMKRSFQELRAKANKDLLSEVICKNHKFAANIWMCSCEITKIPQNNSFAAKILRLSCEFSVVVKNKEYILNAASSYAKTLSQSEKSALEQIVQQENLLEVHQFFVNKSIPFSFQKVKEQIMSAIRKNDLNTLIRLIPNYKLSGSTVNEILEFSINHFNYYAFNIIFREVFKVSRNDLSEWPMRKKNMLLEFVKYSDVDSVQLFLMDAPLIDMHDIGNALVYAAINNKNEIFTFLFEKYKSSVNEGFIYQSAEEVVRNKNWEIAEFLVNTCQELPLPAVEQLLIELAGVGKIETVWSVLEKYPGVSAKVKGLVLENALKNNHWSILDPLKKDKSSMIIPTLDSLKFLINAGQIDLFRLLIENDENISPKDRGALVICAANACSIQAAWGVLGNNAYILPEDREEAIVAAARNGQGALVFYLLNDACELSPKPLGQAALYAASRGEWLLFDALIKANPEKTIQTVSEAVISAVMHRKLELIWKVVQDKDLTHQAKGHAAYYFGCNDVELGFIFKSGNSSESKEIRGFALAQAGKDSNWEVVKDLLQYKNTVSASAARVLIINASKQDQWDIINAILQDYQVDFSEEESIDLMYRAALNNQTDLLERILCTDRSFSEHDLSRIVEIVNRKCNDPENALQLLLQKIPELPKEELVDVSRQNRRGFHAKSAFKFIRNKFGKL